MATRVLSDRELNRATLQRQSLLERTDEAPLEVVERLVGLQAQNPLDPYLALWSRIRAFDPATVGDALLDRTLVRIVVMRGTIHLVTADDALGIRPLVQPVLDAEIARHSEHAPLLVGVDVDPVLAFAREVLATEALPGPRLRDRLAEEFPELPAAALAYACRCHLPLVQVPPRGVWGRSAQVTSFLLDAWVGRPMRTDVTIDDLVLRYLAAFGPATVADVAAWSRLTGMREVVDRLAPGLRRFADERGRELWDVPDGPLPDPDVAAPVRFLPEYDDVLLSHADRSRFAPPGGPAPGGTPAGPVRGTVLVDGTVQGVWRSAKPARDRGAALVVEHAPMPKRAVAAVEAEARRVAAFWLGDATVEPTVVPMG